MSRLKSMAPPPPPSGSKRTRIMSETEAQDPETISLLVMFDELVRNEKVKYFVVFLFLRVSDHKYPYYCIYLIALCNYNCMV